MIGADDIRLDLNGHTIDGDGVLGCSEEELCDLGVDNTGGHHGVTVEDGSIREFATGIFVFGGNENRLRNLSSSNNLFGGLLLIESVGSRIERNTISSNGLTTDQAGLIVFGAQGTVIEGNSVFANGDIGLLMEGSERNRVERNSISDNPEAGMILEGAENYVGRNDLGRNGDGIVFVGDSKNHGDGIDVNARATKLARNRANRNRELGIEAVKGVKDGGGNRARGNGNPAQCTHVAC